MKDNIIILYKKFLVIKKMGYVKILRNGVTGIGYTFEYLIGKSEDNIPVADFEGIEIKTMHRFSKRKLHLFNATPDGDFLFPIKHLVEEMGYPDTIYKDKKILNISINSKEFTNIGYYKKIKLKVNYEKEKIELIGIKNGKTIDLSISWSFNLIRDRLKSKLEYLAVIEASSKVIESIEYVHYNKIRFYKIKDFNSLIDLVDKGLITITFKVGIFKDGRRAGQTHDRGTDFSIKYDDISNLYKRI